MTGRNFIPFPGLTTRRLVLRQLKSDDYREIFALRSDEAINKYLNRAPAATMDDAQRFITTVTENLEKNNAIYWAITLNDSDNLIGTICLVNLSNDQATAEIGYEVMPDYQGQGLMQEAASAVIDFAFTRLLLQSIEAQTHAENERSISLLKRLRFQAAAHEEHCTIFTLSAG